MPSEGAACRCRPFSEHLRRNYYSDFRANFHSTKSGVMKFWPLRHSVGIVTLCCTREMLHGRAWKHNFSHVRMHKHGGKKAHVVRTIFEHDQIIRPFKCHPHALNQLPLTLTIFGDQRHKAGPIFVSGCNSNFHRPILQLETERPAVVSDSMQHVLSQKAAVFSRHHCQRACAKV